MTNEESEQKPIDSNKQLAMQLGESQRQIARYIRLTNLIPKILNMVDEGKIAFTVAVELSYLKEEEQYELHAIMDLEQCTPSLSQACRLKVYLRGYFKCDCWSIHTVCFICNTGY